MREKISTKKNKQRGKGKTQRLKKITKEKFKVIYLLMF